MDCLSEDNCGLMEEATINKPQPGYMLPEERLGRLPEAVGGGVVKIAQADR